MVFSPYIENARFPMSNKTPCQTYATYADPSPQKRNFPPDLGAGASRQLRFNYLSLWRLATAHRIGKGKTRAFQVV